VPQVRCIAIHNSSRYSCVVSGVKLVFRDLERAAHESVPVAHHYVPLHTVLRVWIPHESGSRPVRPLGRGLGLHGLDLAI
jgi:hypothetical protein